MWFGTNVIDKVLSILILDRLHCLIKHYLMPRTLSERERERVDIQSLAEGHSECRIPSVCKRNLDEISCADSKAHEFGD